MPVLFAISVLALVALLWAATSAARHIRRTRRRRRRTSGFEAISTAPGRIGLHIPEPASIEKVSIEEITPYTEAVISRPAAPVAMPPREVPRVAVSAPRAPLVVPERPYVPTPAYVPKLTYARVSPYVSAARKQPEAPLGAQPVDEVPLPPPVEISKARSFESRMFSFAREQSEEARTQTAAAPLSGTGSASVPTAAALEESPAPLRDPVGPKKPSLSLHPVLRRHGMAGDSGRVERADWSYFNKDMGDLTDPYETPRTRPKIASGDSRR